MCAIVWNVPKNAVYHMAVKTPIDAILREWRRTIGSEITHIMREWRLMHRSYIIKPITFPPSEIPLGTCSVRHDVSERIRLVQTSRYDSAWVAVRYQDNPPCLACLFSKMA